MKWKGESFRLQKKEIIPLVLAGLIFSSSSLLLFLSYNYMDAGIASTILFVYPVLVALIMMICFHERISPIVWGGILGNIWNVFGLGLPLGTPGLAIFGLVSGVYVGAWAMALAEIVDAIPIFMRRISLKRGVGLLIAGLAFGRTLGGLLHFYFRW